MSLFGSPSPQPSPQRERGLIGVGLLYGDEIRGRE